MLKHFVRTRKRDALRPQLSFATLWALKQLMLSRKRFIYVEPGVFSKNRCSESRSGIGSQGIVFEVKLAFRLLYFVLRLFVRLFVALDYSH